MNAYPTDITASPLVRDGLDHMAQGMTIFDRDLKLVAWNQQFLDLLKFPHDIAQEGVDFEVFIRHNAMRGEYGEGDVDQQVAERVNAARRFEHHDFNRTSQDGTIIRVVGSPIPSGGFVTVYTDITDEIRREQILEQRVAQRTKELILSEERLQLIADEVPAGIAHLDPDLKFIFVNQRFARAYGYRPQDLIGRLCADVLHPATMAESHRFFEQARRGAVVDFEMTVSLPRNRSKDIRTFLRPARPSAGDITGFYLLSVDVTHRKAANQALMQSHKMDALGRLSSGISHDFNNLLAIILGNLVPLAEQLEQPALVKEFLDPSIAAARRGSSLTRRLLTLARSEPIDPRPVRLDVELADLIELLRGSIPESIEIDFTCQMGLPKVIIDPAQIEMTLLNLAVNARDSIDGTGEIAIRIDKHTLNAKEADLRKLPAGQYVRIRVIDNGCGISAEEREQIFEPFFTSKSDSGGTGLGLAMVFGFVRQSNGAIWVDSVLDKGSTFSILLPTAEPNAQPDVKAPADIGVHQDIEKADPVEGLVLLVEDNEELRKTLRRQLVELGCQCLEAEDARVAQGLLETVSDINMVVSDISMPGEIDGIGLAKFMADRFPETGLVLMSGQHGSAPGGDALRAFTFLGKPFDKQDLAQALIAASKQTGIAAGQQLCPR